MTVNSSYAFEPFLIGTSYIFSFEYIYPEHIAVYWLDGNQSVIQALDPLGWSLVPGPYSNNRYQGGTITVTEVPPSNAVYLGVFRETEISQNLDYPPEGRFPSQAHEFALDKLTLIAQELSRGGGGSSGGGGPSGDYLRTDGGNEMLSILRALRGFRLGNDGADFFYNTVDSFSLPLLVSEINLYLSQNLGVVGNASAERFYAQMDSPGNIINNNELTTKAYVDALLGGSGQLPDGTVDDQILTWDADAGAWVPYGGVLFKANFDAQFFGDIEIRPNYLNGSLRRAFMMLTQEFGMEIGVDQATDDVVFYQTDAAGTATKVWAAFYRDRGVALNYNSKLALETSDYGVIIHAPDDVNGGLGVWGGISVAESVVIENRTHGVTALVLKKGGFQMDNNDAANQSVVTYFGQLLGANWQLTEPVTGTAPITYQWITNLTGTIGVTFQTDGNVTIPVGRNPVRSNDLVTKAWTEAAIAAGGGGSVIPNGDTSGQGLRWNNGTQLWDVADSIRIPARGASSQFTLLATASGMAWVVGSAGIALYATGSTGTISGNEIIGINPVGNTFLSYNKIPKINTEDYGMSVSGFIQASAGGAAGPSYTFGTDSDTGMYSGGAGTLGFAVNGTQRGRFTSTGLNVTGTIVSSGSISGTSGSFSGSVSAAGASFTATVSCNNNKVGGVMTPTVGNEAANKSYVDSKIPADFALLIAPFQTALDNANIALAAAQATIVNMQARLDALEAFDVKVNTFINNLPDHGLPSGQVDHGTWPL
jgi:hypothetical protein